jgi:hypothetical protein
MESLFSRLAKLGVALIVAAGLGFGVSELRAGAAADCPIDYGSGQLGYCVDNQACADMCTQVYGESIGECRLNCCQCALR